MPETRKNGNHSWTPKALAVISFALALLAAHPTLQASEPAAGRAVVVTQTAVPCQPQLLEARVEGRKRVRTTVEATRSEMRFHILATVEILQRLIASELNLRPAAQVLPFVLYFEPVYLGSVAPAISTPRAMPDLTPPLPLDSERRFAIARLLLAPPLV